MRSPDLPKPKKMSFIEQHRRDQIIDALITNVAQQGYDGASFANVALGAGINKGVALYHFKDKSQMVEAAVACILRRLASSVEPLISSEPTATGKLKAYIRGELSYIERNRDDILALSSLLNGHRNPQGALYLRARTEESYIASVEAILEQGQQSGEFRAFDRRSMAIVLMNAVNGAIAQWTLASHFPLAAYATEVATIFDLATRSAGTNGNSSASPIPFSVESPT